jgi:hypothetical protein
MPPLRLRAPKKQPKKVQMYKGCRIDPWFTPKQSYAITADPFWTTTASTTTATISYTNNDWMWSGSTGGDLWWSNNTITTSANTTNYLIDFQPATVVWRDVHFQTYHESEEDRAARLVSEAAAFEEQRRLNAQRDLERVGADARAEQLLLAHLDDDEVCRWAEHREINLRSQSGRRYCIDGRKTMHNIFEVDEHGERIKELCVYAAGDIPLNDNVLAQVLALRYAEEQLLARANVWDLLNARARV